MGLKFSSMTCVIKQMVRLWEQEIVLGVMCMGNDPRCGAARHRCMGNDPHCVAQGNALLKLQCIMDGRLSAITRMKTHLLLPLMLLLMGSMCDC